MSTTQQREGYFNVIGRLSYPKFYTPEVAKGGDKPRYGCVIMIPKDDKEHATTLKKLNAYIDQLKSKPPLKGKRDKDIEVCLLDGDDEAERGPTYENFRGYWIISANRAEKQGRPQTVDRAKRPVDEKKGVDMFYGGCWCEFYIGLYVPKEHLKVCASLEAVRFLRDDDPFGNRVNADQVFADLGEDEDDESSGKSKYDDLD